MSRNLGDQIACLRHVIASAKDCSDDILTGAEAGLRSLEWLQRNVDVVKEVRRLMTEDPAIIAVLQAFPGSRIGGVAINGEAKAGAVSGV